MSETILKGGTLILPGETPGTVRAEPGDLAMRSGIILAAGDGGVLPEDFDPDVIDVSGQYVMPGLVNAHGHAAMSLLRGYADDMPLMPWLQQRIWPIEAVMTPEDIAAGTALAVAEMLGGGTTCMADMYFPMPTVAEVCRQLGIRAVLSQGLIGMKDQLERDLRVSRDFVRTWHGAADGRIRTQLGPHAPYTCPPHHLRAVADLARELGVGIHTHLAETSGEVRDMRRDYGKDPTNYLREAGILDVPVTAAHGVHLDAQSMEILRRCEASVVHCPRSNLRLACGIAPVVEMLDAGVTVGLGTDGAASAATLDMWEEMRFAGYLQKVKHDDATALPAERLLFMATRGGARALGLEDVGELSPGFRADIIVVSRDRTAMVPEHDPLSLLAYCAGTADVQRVFVDGNPVVKDGRLLSADERDITRLARSAAADMAERVGTDD